jgi:hypothetical protein
LGCKNAQSAGVTYIDLRHCSSKWNVIDKNITWNFGGPIRTKYLSVQNDEWASWQALGWDLNSLVADPLFENVHNDNFKLKPASPAFKLGFNETPLEKIGIQAE